MKCCSGTIWQTSSISNSGINSGYRDSMQRGINHSCLVPWTWDRDNYQDLQPEAATCSQLAPMASVERGKTEPEPQPQMCNTEYLRRFLLQICRKMPPSHVIHELLVSAMLVLYLIWMVICNFVQLPEHSLFDNWPQLASNFIFLNEFCIGMWILRLSMSV